MTTIATIFLPNNLMRDVTKIVASSRAPSPPPGPIIPRKSGAANFGMGGVYTGAIPRYYVFQIDSLDNGQLSTSTFRWSNTGPGPPWNDVLQPIVPNVVQTVPDGHGLEYIFATGSGTPDVNLGDRWDLLADVPYHVGFLLDNRPDYEYRSNTVTTGEQVWIQYDMGTPQVPPQMVWGHHNLLSTTQTRVQSSETVTFSALEYNQLVPWAPTHLHHALVNPQSARYWRILHTCGANQGFIRAAEWYLGTAIGMSRNFNSRYLEEHIHLGAADTTQFTRGPAPLGLVPRRYGLVWGQRRPADIDALNLLFSVINDRVRQLRHPFWLLKDDAPTIFDLVQWESDYRIENRLEDVHDVPQTLLQVVRTAA